MNYGLLAPDEREQLSGTALTSGLLSALAGAAGSAGRPWGQVIANSLAGGLQGYQGTFDNALQSKLMQQKMLQQDQEFGLRNQELKMRMAEAQRQQDTQAQQQAMLPKLAEQFKVQPELLQMYPDVAKDLIKRQLIPQTAEVGSVSPDKFTPESLAKFRQSNNYADLVPLEKQTSGTTLSKLMTEMNSLPEGDPRRQMYADAIKKETQFAPPSQTKVEVNTGQKGFDNTLKLRGDFRSEPIYKAHQEVKSAYSQIQTALKEGTPVGDMAGATKIMKLLDPGSVVRESELGMAMAATGLEDRLRNYAKMVVTGEKLTPLQRKEFQTLADGLFAESANQYNTKRSEYKDIADRNELNAIDVVGSDEKLPKKDKPAVQALPLPAKPSAMNLKKGSVYQTPKGALRWNGKAFEDL